MKTTIKINGLDVEFTDQKPTREGVYWHTYDANEPPSPVIIFKHTKYGLTGQYGNDLLPDFHGLWSAPLVPVTEVEKSYLEGFLNAHHKITDSVKSAALECFEESHARRVVEGLE